MNFLLLMCMILAAQVVNATAFEPSSDETLPFLLELTGRLVVVPSMPIDALRQDVCALREDDTDSSAKERLAQVLATHGSKAYIAESNVEATLQMNTFVPLDRIRDNSLLTITHALIQDAAHTKTFSIPRLEAVAFREPVIVPAIASGIISGMSFTEGGGENVFYTTLAMMSHLTCHLLCDGLQSAISSLSAQGLEELDRVFLEKIVSKIALDLPNKYAEYKRSHNVTFAFCVSLLREHGYTIFAASYGDCSIFLYQPVDGLKIILGGKRRRAEEGHPFFPMIFPDCWHVDGYPNNELRFFKCDGVEKGSRLFLMTNGVTDLIGEFDTPAPQKKGGFSSSVVSFSKETLMTLTEQLSQTSFEADSFFSLRRIKALATGESQAARDLKMIMTFALKQGGKSFADKAASDSWVFGDDFLIQRVSLN